MVDPHYENPIDLLENIPKDLSKLPPAKRRQVYNEVCRQMGLNPNSFPLDEIRSKVGVVLTINEIGTSQLRHIHGISISVKSQELLPYEDQVFDQELQAKTTVTRHLAIVTVIATCGGRSEEATGAVEAFGPMVRSTALKKAETQARRRATLAICGNGWSKPKSILQPLQIPLEIPMVEKLEPEGLERIQLPAIPRETTALQRT